MKRISVVVVALALFGAACDSDSPTTPSEVVPRFTATLLPGNEVPPIPITNADSTGSGTATITLNVTRNAAQQVTAATADFSVTVSGFPANTVLTGAHIHSARAGTNAGVSVSTGLASGEVTLATGSGSFTKNGINVAADLAQNLLNDPAGHYFNVHTTLNTGGAVRAQLVRTQ